MGQSMNSEETSRQLPLSYGKSTFYQNALINKSATRYRKRRNHAAADAPEKDSNSEKNSNLGNDNKASSYLKNKS